MPHNGTSNLASPRELIARPALGSTTVVRSAPEPRRPFGPAATFRSLRHRNYRLYFFGQVISLTGSWIQATALMWVAYNLTHASRWPAWIMAVQTLPTFFLGAWAGALADRWPKRPLIMATQGLLLVLALALYGLVLAGRVEPWCLLAVSAATGLVLAVDLPARLAFVMDMVGREDLINAVALNSLSFNVARVIGPALGGLMLICLGPGLCFLVNALSFVAVLVALARMDVVETVPARSKDRGLRPILDGFAYLAGQPALAVLVLVAGTTTLFGWPFVSLLPALAERVLNLGAQGYSTMVSGTGLGALAAALTVATYGSLAHRRTFIVGGLVLISTGLVGLSAASGLVAASTFCALVGYGLILFFATSQSVVQLSAGDHNRGRMMGIWAMVVSGALPLGNALAGPAADRWGVPVIVLVLGLSCAGAALGLAAALGVWVRSQGSGVRSQESAW